MVPGLMDIARFTCRSRLEKLKSQCQCILVLLRLADIELGAIEGEI